MKFPKSWEEACQRQAEEVKLMSATGMKSLKDIDPSVIYKTLF